MGKYKIYRDDRMYPISADTFEELQELRFRENCGFMSHSYGSICETLDPETHKYKYFDIYTGKEVQK